MYVKREEHMQLVTLYNMVSATFPVTFQLFSGKLKLKKIMGIIRGENIERGEEFFYGALPPQRKSEMVPLNKQLNSLIEKK